MDYRSTAYESPDDANRNQSTDWFWKSAAAGLLAGIVMAMFAMAATAIQDDTLWTPVRTIAAFFLGEEEAGTAFDVDTVLIGMGIHVMLSMAFGVIFGFVAGVFTNRFPLPGQVIVGIVYGVILWLVNTFLVAPLLPGGALIEDNIVITTIPSWIWGVSHLVFGGVLGYVYAMSRRGRTTLLTG